MGVALRPLSVLHNIGEPLDTRAEEELQTMPRELLLQIDPIGVLI